MTMSMAAEHQNKAKNIRFEGSSDRLKEKSFPNSINLLRQVDWDDYEKVRVVGKGAFGTATLYRKREDESLVVLKEINMHDLNAAERLLAINEVKVLSILDHPNIVCYFDSYEFEGKLLIEMEYCDAGTLGEFVAQLSNPLKEHEILVIFQQIVSAITYLHDHHILHRDLKTANIFMTRETVIKVGDFGIAKMLTTHKAGASTMVGTPYYISPEMCEGKPYDEKTDIWALGCILYEIVCLHKTFEGTNLPALINKIVKGQFAPIRRHYSSDLKQLINDLLQKDPDLRPHAYEVYETVAELINKSQLDRYRVWSLQPELFSFDVSTGAALANHYMKSSLRNPRSVVYEVKVKEPHITLVQVPLPRKQRIRELAKGKSHFLALTYEFEVYSWGDADKGQLGLGVAKVDSVTLPSAIDVIRGKNIIRVCAGDGFSIFMSKFGLVMSCGDGSSGCLGHIETNHCYFPKLVDRLLSVDISTINCGPNHVVAISGEGKAFAWGHNSDGRLGIGMQSQEPVRVPTSVVFPEDVIVKNVFCGPDATMFVDEKGSLWACGSNVHNKLGLGGVSMTKSNKVESSLVPEKVKWLRDHVQSVSIGPNNSSLLLEGGKVLVLGLNSDGQLGLGHVRFTRRSTPVRKLEDSTIMKVQCGSSFVLASTYENELYFWGGRYIPHEDETEARHSLLFCDPVIANILVEEPKSEVNALSDLYDVIKVGESNWSLMKIVEKIGPDYPVLQIRDPQVIISNLKQLALLSNDSSSRRDLILSPQSIVALYSSQVHLQFGETVGISNFYCFAEDRVFVILDTTIALPSEMEKRSKRARTELAVLPEEPTAGSELLPEKFTTNTIPKWVAEELNSTTNIVALPANKTRQAIIPTERAAISRTMSLPHCFSTEIENSSRKVKQLESELEATKARLKESNQKVHLHQNQIRDLQEQVSRLRRREQLRSKKLKCFIQ